MERRLHHHRNLHHWITPERYVHPSPSPQRPLLHRRMRSISLRILPTSSQSALGEGVKIMNGGGDILETRSRYWLNSRSFILTPFQVIMLFWSINTLLIVARCGIPSSGEAQESIGRVQAKFAGSEPHEAISRTNNDIRTTLYTPSPSRTLDLVNLYLTVNRYRKLDSLTTAHDTLRLRYISVPAYFEKRVCPHARQWPLARQPARNLAAQSQKESREYCRKVERNYLVGKRPRPSAFQPSSPTHSHSASSVGYSAMM